MAGAPNRGFALVLVLTMMALALSLLLSMNLLLQVETQRSAQTLLQLRAQESAQLALIMALGDLQRHAGPDQAVTARKAITSNTDPFWTGAWDSRSPGSPPHWLVSWQDQNRPPPGAALQLVGPGTTDNQPGSHVWVPGIEVMGPDTHASARIAWWISDEGVKASVAQRPLHQRPRPNFLDASRIGSLQLALASSHGLETLFPDYNRFDSDDASRLDRMPSVEQLLQLSDFLLPGADFAGEAPFHVLTPMSLGVLSNTLDDNEGGLMRDLSLFPQLLGNGLEDYLQLGETHAKASAQAIAPIESKRLSTGIRGLDAIGPLSDGDIATPVAPILSNFMMAFTIRSESPASSHPNFYLRMRFFCEFWNPYTHALRMEDPLGHPLHLELEVTGLPEITVHKTTGSLDHSAPISIQDLTSQPGHPDNAMVLRLIHDHSEDWLPGQSKNWTGVDASHATGRSPYDSIQNDGKDWDDPDHNLGGSVGIDTHEPRLSADLRHESAVKSLIGIKVFLHNQTTGHRELVSELEDIEYAPVSTRLEGYSNTHKGAKFGYHFILRDPHLSTLDSEYFRGRWLYEHDPRNPKPAFNSDWNLDKDPSIPSGSAYVPVKDGISPLLIPDPAEIFDPGNINTIAFRRFMDRSSGMNGNLYHALWQDAPIFELPRSRLHSLASLQHLYFHNERPFQVGNSWGRTGAVNTSSWFDRYYFSGFSRNDDISEFQPQKAPPNPSLIFYDTDPFASQLAKWQSDAPNDAAAAQEPANRLLVANRFNINSTSVAAWKAVLGSLRLSEFEYLNYPDADTSDLSTLHIQKANRIGTFARFSHSLEETYDAPATPDYEDTEPVAPTAFYRHGARRFDKDQLEALAREIVRLIKERGAPFTTMEAFLSAEGTDQSSLLEKAIATVFAPSGRQQWDHPWETTGIRGPASEHIDIDHFAPGFLTQADILTAIGPMLAPRSDTFTLRARGEALSPAGTTSAAATLEATVQRIPESIRPQDPRNRPFKLISIRWIQEDNL